MQLRIPGNRTIEDMISVLSLSILESIKRELDSMEVPFDSFHVLESRIVSAISPYVHAFDACGSDPVCSEGVQGKPIPDAGDRIYMLSLPTAGLDPLVQGILTEVLESVRLGLDSAARESLNARVLSSIQRELDRYMFYNPICGKADVCRSSHAVSPWTEGHAKQSA
ncbi:MAG TPA: hypothetical protein VLR94_06295 [Acidobacteriota bacterium]|nr:hypothetical protein [Acidobacteriota bacterium]